MKIESYEVHAMLPTRFFRWAILSVDPIETGVVAIYKCRVLQQLFRNFQGVEEWRAIPEVIIAPNVTVEELPETEPVLTEDPHTPGVFSADPTSL